MYIEAIEQVFNNSSKVLLDAEGSGNLLYLPVDKLIEQNSESRARDAALPTQNTETPRREAAAQELNNQGRADPRSRGVR